MSSRLGTCPLYGDPALLGYNTVTVEEASRAEERLSDVACLGEECRNYIPSNRVEAALGRRDPRRTWKST